MPTTIALDDSTENWGQLEISGHMIGAGIQIFIWPKLCQSCAHDFVDSCQILARPWPTSRLRSDRGQRLIARGIRLSATLCVQIDWRQASCSLLECLAQTVPGCRVGYSQSERRIAAADRISAWNPDGSTACGRRAAPDGAGCRPRPTDGARARPPWRRAISLGPLDMHSVPRM